MRIPRYQYTQGTSLSARSTPILRRDASLRPNVSRNVNAYLSDPKAGQRNIGLEVEAAGRSQYIVGAVTKGVSDFTNILLKLETDQQATQAYYDLKSKAENALSDMKDQGISRPVNVLNSDGTINETLVPAYKNSAVDFQNDLEVERKRIARGLNRTASNAFARSSINVMMQANAQAAAYNRKQAIAWIGASAWKTLMAARDHMDVEEIAAKDFFKQGMGPLEFEKLVYLRHRGIAVDSIKAAIYAARMANGGWGDEEALGLIRRAIIGKGEYSYLDIKGDPDDARKLLVERIVVSDSEYGYLKYGQDGDDEALLKIVGATEKEIQGIINRKFKKNVTRYLSDFLNNKDLFITKDGITEFETPLAKIDDLLEKGHINADGYNVLANAIIAEETGSRYSDWATLGEMQEKIGDYSYEDIALAQLTTAHKSQLIQMKVTYEQQVRNWESANNPAGNEGHVALQLLRSEYHISVAGIASSMDKGLRKQQSEGWALAQKQLRFYMMGLIPNEWDGKILDVDDELKPMAAFEWVKHHLENRKKPDGTRKDKSLTGNGGDQTPGRLGFLPNELATLEQFEIDHLNGRTIEDIIKEGGEYNKKILQVLSLPPYNISIPKEELEKIGVEQSWEELIDDLSFWERIRNSINLGDNELEGIRSGRYQ